MAIGIMERTGIVERGQHLQKVYSSFIGLSPAPKPATSRERMLQARVDELISENEALAAELEKLREALPEIKLVPRGGEVMIRYVAALDVMEYRIEGQPYRMEDLKGPRKSFIYSRPRLVCMWAVRRLCPSLSLPAIARLFAKTDHTSVMHANRRARQIMDQNPELMGAAALTFGAFGEVL
jgi:chromosomal replication initiation ATPase DnaA